VDNQYLIPDNLYAVNYPGHTGLYLKAKISDSVYVLDPNDSLDGKYRVLERFDNVSKGS